MPFQNTWDLTTEKGKKRVHRLLEIVKTLQHRDDLKPHLKGEKLFRGIKYQAIKQKLQREQEQDPPSDLGKAWSHIPEKPHIIVRLIPDEARRRKLAEDANKEDMTVPKLEEEFPELRGLNARSRSEIFLRLGVRRPFTGHAALHGKTVKPDKSAGSVVAPHEWWLRLTPEQGQEFLADFRKDYRLQGNTNTDLCDKWSRVTGGVVSEQSLGKAARHFGETKNRVQIAQEHKTPAQVEKMISGVLTPLIMMQGALIDPGADALYERILREFVQVCRDAEYELTREAFDSIVDRVAWTEGKQGTLTLLDAAINAGLPLEEYYEDYRHMFTLAIVQEKAQERRGLTNRLRRIRFEAGLLKGVGRFASPEELKSGDDFKFPPNSFRDPFPVLTENAGSILVLNGANIGTRHTPVITQNPRVNTLVMGREEGDSAIIITNTLDLYTKKAGGPSRVMAAIWAGMNVNPDFFPDSYRDEVLRLLEEKPDDAVVYQKPREALHNGMSGWNKITWEPKSKRSKEVRPVFPRNIYVVFGLREHQCAATMAYWHVHYLTRTKQERIKSRLRIAYGVLNDAERGRIEMPPDLEARILALHDLGERTIISDVIEEYWQLYYQRALGYLAKKFEEVIPNCKVIGMSTTHVKIGPETMTIQIPPGANVTDGTLSQYTHSYGPKVLRQEMPRFVTICHPYGLGPRGTGREVDAGGKRDHAIVWNAPACLEETYIRQELKHVPGRDHPMAQKVWSEMSTPGVLRIRLVNGMLMPEDISIETINSYGERRIA